MLVRSSVSTVLSSIRSSNTHTSWRKDSFNLLSRTWKRSVCSRFHKAFKKLWRTCPTSMIRVTWGSLETSRLEDKTDPSDISIDCEAFLGLFLQLGSIHCCSGLCRRLDGSSDVHSSERWNRRSGKLDCCSYQGEQQDMAWMTWHCNEFLDLWNASLTCWSSQSQLRIQLGEKQQLVRLGQILYGQFDGELERRRH